MSEGRPGGANADERTEAESAPAVATGAPIEATAAPPPRMQGWHERTFAALRVPNYRRFFVGQGLSAVGSWSRSAAQAWLVHELTGSEAWLGIVSAASLLPIALLAGVAGGVVDRADKRR